MIRTTLSAIAVVSVFTFASCGNTIGSDPKVQEDVRAMKEDMAKLKEDLAKLREDHNQLVKDAAKAEVKAEDKLEGSKMD